MVEIIENRHSNEKIVEMYKKKEINIAESLLLLSTEKDVFFNRFITGIGEFRLNYGSQISSDEYYTNVPAVMNALYSMHIKFPNYHFDELLEQYLMIKSSEPGFVYYVLTTIKHQLHYEKNGAATFKLANVILILESCKNTIKNDYHYFLTTKYYDARNGYYEKFKEYNQTFKEIVGYDLFDKSSESEKHL